MFKLVTMFGSGAKKGVKALAGGRAQQQMGAQSPYLPGAIVRLGRFAYTSSALWVAAVWYSGYANMRTTPGGGPQLVLPGKKVVGPPDRPNKSLPQALQATAKGVKNAAGGGSTDTGGNTVGAGIAGAAARVAAARVARQTIGKRNFHYAPVRPMPQSLNSDPCNTDCSGWVTLVYKMIGAPDPNGAGYNGSGNTDTLQKNGVPVKRPNIGDMAFWGNPDHVALVTGTGADPQIMEFGAPPYPVVSSMSREGSAHQRFIGYRSYL